MMLKVLFMGAFVIGLTYCQDPCWRPDLEKFPNWTPKPGLDTSGCDWATTVDGATTVKPTTSGATTTTKGTSFESTEPVECTAENEGSCECGDNSQGFYTYTFWQGEVQRCFTIYFPLDRATEQLPVLFSPNCYAEDTLDSLHMGKESSDPNKAASRYGYARIGVSTPDHNWLFGHDTVINDEYPMPCSDEDSKDIAYIRTIFNYLESRPESFDMTRVYAAGFSQNSMFSAYIGYCFPDNVVGVYQAGSGLAITEQGMRLPGCQGQVRISDLMNDDICPWKYNFKGEYSFDCSSCIETHPCEECQYFPIYPCYSPKRPMVHCVFEYNNDPISTKTIDGVYYSTAENMYEALETEGHDARLYIFSKSDDGEIEGNHQDVKNLYYWQVGCMGMTSPCSSECESAFIACVENLNGDNPTGLEKTENFASCIDPKTFSGLPGCTEECAPTLAMMSTSETPTYAPNSNWGTGSDTAEDQPDTSLCKIE
jgi:hypothetical protein